MLSHHHTVTLSHPHTVTSDPSLQVRACNLLGGYLTHKETNMRYLSLETLSHLATSDLSREAVKKHQDIVLNSLKVSVCYKYLWITVYLEILAGINFSDFVYKPCD